MDVMLRFEDLVIEAIILGARTEDEVYPYVYMRDDRADRQTIKNIIAQVYMGLDTPADILYN
jgi:hypothetical protein